MGTIHRIASLGVGLLVLPLAQSASAVTIGFEPSEGYAPGPLVGQQGWGQNNYIGGGNPLNGTVEVSSSAPLAGSQSLLYTQTSSGFGADVSKANVITVVRDGTSATDLIATVLIQADNNALGNGQVGIFFGSDTAAGTTQINTLLNNVNSGAGTGLLQVASGISGFTTFDNTYRGEVLELTYNVDFDNQVYTLFQRDFPSGTSSQVGSGVFNFSGSFAPDTPGGLSYTVDVGAILRAGTGRIDNITLAQAPIPEPTTLGLAMLGLGGLALRRRSRA